MPRLGEAPPRGSLGAAWPCSGHSTTSVLSLVTDCEPLWKSNLGSHGLVPGSCTAQNRERVHAHSFLKDTLGGCHEITISQRGVAGKIPHSADLVQIRALPPPAQMSWARVFISLSLAVAPPGSKGDHLNHMLSTYIIIVNTCHVSPSCGSRGRGQLLPPRLLSTSHRKSLGTPGWTLLDSSSRLQSGMMPAPLSPESSMEISKWLLFNKKRKMTLMQ